jgi:hypothetical protein
LKKPPPIVLDESRPLSASFDALVLSEGGYKVEFSNQGKKPHDNPAPANPGKQNIPCILLPLNGCPNMTSRKDGLCRDHAPKKGEARPKVIRRHWADWIGRIIPPGMSREQCLTWAPAHVTTIEKLIEWMQADKKAREVVLEGLVSDLMESLKGKVPDSTTMENDLEDPKSRGAMASGIVRLTKKIVNAHFPQTRYGGEVVKAWKYNKVRMENIPVRVLGALLVLGVASEEANRGDLWAHTRTGRPSASKRASVFMPMAYYYLRVHLGATRTQAGQSIRH